MSELYQEEILERAHSPSRYGVLPAADIVLQGTNASCGDEVTIYVTFAKAKDVTTPIVGISWTGQGCVISQAAMDALADKIIEDHLTLEQLSHLNESDLEQLLGLSEISIGRIKCLLLGLRTLQSQPI